MFATRSEFIRAAVRIDLPQYREDVLRADLKKTYTLGAQSIHVSDGIKEALAERMCVWARLRLA